MSELNIDTFSRSSKWKSSSENEKERFSDRAKNWEILQSFGITPKIPIHLQVDKNDAIKITKFKKKQINVDDGFVGEVCDSMFSSAKMMKRHRKVHRHEGDDRRHQCPHCPYSTDRKSNFQDHLVVHSGERRHQCPHCHRAFTRKAHLQTHVRIHTGERPFSCGVCGRDFIHKSNLKVHERIHGSVRPYRCPTCGRDFTHLGYLQSHQRIHTQQRPYKCTACDYRATKSGALKTHVIYQHTKKFPHPCPHCERGFMRPSHLQRHVGKFH